MTSEHDDVVERLKSKVAKMEEVSGANPFDIGVRITLLSARRRLARALSKESNKK